MSNHLPLRGVRVHLAGSVPEAATTGEEAGIKEFVQQFTSMLLREGGTVIHGSHPTFEVPLKTAALDFVQADGERDALTLVRAQKYLITPEEVAEVEAQRAYSLVHIIPTVPGNHFESLVPMREWMADRSDVVVAIGGKWYDKNKSRAGVPGELKESLQRGNPGFIVAGFGGAVKGYIKDDPTVFSRLRNGLNEIDNQELSSNSDVDQLVSSIIAQLKLLPLNRENVPSGRLFRILALDGGGIRGVFTAAVLAKWNSMLRSGGDEGFVKHFDMVAGTSTGAILAIGLGLGHSPNQMLNFYRDQGPKIFPKDRKLRHWLKPKHDSETLKEILQSVLGDSILSRDSYSRLVIPTVRATHGESEVIVTAHTSDRTAFKDITAVDAALASAAAPTYFDEANVDDEVALQPYLDGGIWANNPVLPAIAEAVRHLKIPLDRIDVLSVGTMGNETDFTKSLGKGKAGWAGSSVDLFFAAQEHGAANLADSLLSRTRFLRINQETPSEIELDDTSAIEDMAKRGSNVAKDSFESVRSRFLDGSYAADWRSEN
ncbi:CBASS cGAMP-activated phospholipase [Granulosicoccus sp.]|nr:CBASS cGAMP-activated phospholipase [Granulosicoccus sp.]MDB4223667.1 CBASS cGAMP-activated phospholipase [Granulosicoccus sp.]